MKKRTCCYTLGALVILNLPGVSAKMDWIYKELRREKEESLINGIAELKD